MRARMKQRFMQFAAAVLAAVLMASAVPLAVFAAGEDNDSVVRIGIAYGSSAVYAANLRNVTGSGYQLGYYDSDRNFVSVAETGTTAITVLKTQNIYLANGVYTTSAPQSDYSVIGCYHVDLPGTFDSFAAAQKEAAAWKDGFPAWISGEYHVRVGAFATRAEAEERLQTIAVGGASIKGTSTNGVSVVETGSTSILLQFDGGGGRSFAVQPKSISGEKTVTAYGGNQYYGGFQFQRLSSNMNVVNFVELEDYIKGVLPYEMSASWPLEALKAQAVCARNYALLNLNKHKSYGFDLCSSVDCQTYYGLGRANDNSDRAAEKTQGVYLNYDGKPAQVFYYASNGGASEDVYNVWGSQYPYLKGVEDPYEASVAGNISGYNWTVTYTADQLTQQLNKKGYACGTIVRFEVTERSATGNVIAITFTDENGKNVYLTRERVRTVLGLRSQRYSVTAAGGTEETGYSVIGGGTLPALSGRYAAQGSGTVSAVSGENVYVVTGSGVQPIEKNDGTESATGTSFTLSGSGYGHHVGMSQWGAYAMAKQGLTYDKILQFYFAGTTLG